MLAKMLPKVISVITFVCISCFASAAQDTCRSNKEFIIGAGIYDITGPAAEEGMMGYGMLRQQTGGILQRLWARAFIISSPSNEKHVVIVNVDLGQVFQGIKQEVIKQLKNKYGEAYTDENVLITAIHTHSGPGGYSTYTFYNLSTLGFNRANFNTIVDGIVKAIERAQVNMTPAQIKFASGELRDVSFNRSPQAYLQNPAAERAKYSANIDTKMSLLRFDNEHSEPIGMLNWFPVHGVSMNNKNNLINGDNKGYAEYLFEKDFSADYGVKSFVAGFAQANAGDVSPNAYGSEGGSGLAGIAAVEKAGRPQYDLAKQLFTEAQELVTGDVDYRHIFVAMDQLVVDSIFTKITQQTTCPAAIGVSMLAGTQDGEGIGHQGVSCATLSSFLPSWECTIMTTPCQGAKPIALQTGTMQPYPWTPNVLPLQILKIGNLIIVGAPFELTTMTGRRIQEAVEKIFPANEYHIVLAALSNAYAGYVATQEEYQVQRYEGASTHFGPWTEAALRQEYTKLAKALADQQPVPSGMPPINLTGVQTNLQPDVWFDSAPWNKSFGDVYQDVNPSYQSGETVTAIFWGAHPKNDFRTQGTFLVVQQLIEGRWKTVRKDRDWDTEYHWQRSGIAESLVTVRWRIPRDTPPGTYRIGHLGNAKSLSGVISAYAGHSRAFKVS